MYNRKCHHHAKRSETKKGRLLLFRLLGLRRFPCRRRSTFAATLGIFKHLDINDLAEKLLLALMPRAMPGCCSQRSGSSAAVGLSGNSTGHCVDSLESDLSWLSPSAKEAWIVRTTVFRQEDGLLLVKKENGFKLPFARDEKVP